MSSSGSGGWCGGVDAKGDFGLVARASTIHVSSPKEATPCTMWSVLFPEYPHNAVVCRCPCLRLVLQL